MQVQRAQIVGAGVAALLAVGVPLVASGVEPVPEPTPGTAVEERLAAAEASIRTLDARVTKLETPTATPTSPTTNPTTGGPLTLPATGTPPDPGPRLVRSPNPSPVADPAKLTGAKITVRCADNPETALNSRTFTAGTVITFARGCTWPNTRVTIRSAGTAAQPVLVNTTGAGAAPTLGSTSKPGRFKDDGVLTVQGSHTHVTGLRFTNTPQGVGVRVEGNNNVIDQVEAHNIPIGVWFKGNSNRAWNNHVHDLRMMGGTPGPDDDYGATGFVVEGDDTHLEGNTTRNAKAPSVDYPPFDGAFVDIWRVGNRTVLRHNYLDDAPHFLEAGGDGSGTANDVRMVGNVAKTRLDPWWFNISGQYSIRVDRFAQSENRLTRIN